MTNRVAAGNYAQPWQGDTRPPLPLVGTERQILTTFLDWQRGTLDMRCAGLAPGQLSQRSVPPSLLSLHGLLRHLAAMERWWFRIQFAGEDIPLLHYSDEDPDQDFEWLDGDVTEALSTWRDECDRARAIVAATGSLEATGVREATGEPLCLRAVLVQMIAEYARHNGHADLLRERIDGATGY